VERYKVYVMKSTINAKSVALNEFVLSRVCFSHHIKLTLCWRRIILKTFIIILLVMLFIAILFYFMPIKIKLKTIRVNDDDFIVFRVKTLYGIVNLKFEVPFLKIVIIDNKLSLKYKAKIASNKTNRLFKWFSKTFTKGDFDNIKKYFHHDPVLFRRIKNYWAHNIIINDFSLILKYGTSDAAFTALLYGTFWGIFGSVLAILKNNLRFNTKDVLITPYFDKETFNIELSCIIKFKFGDIINTGIMTLRRHKQRKNMMHDLKDTLNAS
jgi:hypothetical protein